MFQDGLIGGELCSSVIFTNDVSLDTNAYMYIGNRKCKVRELQIDSILLQLILYNLLDIY